MDEYILYKYQDTNTDLRGSFSISNSQNTIFLQSQENSNVKIWLNTGTHDGVWGKYIC